MLQEKHASSQSNKTFLKKTNNTWALNEHLRVDVNFPRHFFEPKMIRGKYYSREEKELKKSSSCTSM